MAAPREPERHAPLPGLLGLPLLGWRRLPPPGRAAVALAVIALAVGLVLLWPQLERSKQRAAERERRERAAALAERRRRLIAEARPRRGRTAARGAAAVRAVETAITADALRRHRSGEVGTAVRRTDCQPLGGGRLVCVAVTSDIPRGPGSRGGRVGYPYRALLDERRGRFRFCKVAGTPGEGALSREGLVDVPAGCGG